MVKSDLFSFRDDAPGPNIMLPSIIIGLELKHSPHRNRLRAILGHRELDDFRGAATRRIKSAPAGFNLYP
jgi:hypothetical protein